MKKLLLLIFFSTFVFFSHGQIASNRVSLKYLLTKSKVNELKANKIFIRSKSQPINKRFEIGNFKNKYFQFIINYKDGVLNIDPFSIIDKRTNPKVNVEDPYFDSCKVEIGDTTCFINANTKNDLIIDLNRRKIGNPTTSITLPYQTFILGLNSISVKFRPKVKDYNDSLYHPNVVSSNINLGLTIGYSYGWTKFTHRSNNSFSLTPAFSLGFSAISLSKEPLTKKVSVTFQPSNFVLSPAASLIIARNDLGLIFSYGTDIMFGKNAEYWGYQKKGWFGIGISAGLKL